MLTRTILLWLSVLLTPLPVFGLDYYVNGSTGTDSDTCGQLPTTPCKTIKKALDNIPDGEVTIKIARGTYVESDLPLKTSSSIKNTLVFDGGWSSDFTNHILVAASTVIHPADTTSTWYSLFHLAVRDSNSDMDVTIRHLTINKDRPGTINGAIALLAEHNGRVIFSLDDVVISEIEGSAIRLQCDTGGTIQATVTRSIFYGNTSNTLYGAARNNGQLSLTMKQDLFHDNSMAIDLWSKDSGSIMFFLANTIITHNESDAEGMAMRLGATGSGSLVLHSLNNTITDNTSTNYGGAVHANANASGSVHITMTNTILRNNHARISAADLSLYQGYLSDDSGEIFFSADYCILGEYEAQHGNPIYTSTNDVDADPSLNSTYHLTSGSPAKDAGLCGYLTGIGPYQYHRVAPYDDIDGDQRPGWGKLMGCDIGADEYRFPWILFTPSLRKGGPPPNPR